jgi:hypothetical protein
MYDPACARQTIGRPNVLGFFYNTFPLQSLLIFFIAISVEAFRAKWDQ